MKMQLFFIHSREKSSFVSTHFCKINRLVYYYPRPMVIVLVFDPNAQEMIKNNTVIDSSFD